MGHSTISKSDGKIVSARGELDYAQEAHRNAVLNARLGAAIATAAARAPTAVPDDSTRAAPGADTQQRRTPAPTAWITAVVLALASAALACAIQRPDRSAAA